MLSTMDFITKEECVQWLQLLYFSFGKNLAVLWIRMIL